MLVTYRWPHNVGTGEEGVVSPSAQCRTSALPHFLPRALALTAQVPFLFLVGIRMPESSADDHDRSRPTPPYAKWNIHRSHFGAGARLNGATCWGPKSYSTASSLEVDRAASNVIMLRPWLRLSCSHLPQWWSVRFE